MKNLIKTTSIITIVLAISSCSSLGNLFHKKKEVPQLDYIEGSLKMDMKKFFNGDLEGFAIVQDANGKITETMTAKINGKWQENKGVVQFNYHYSDGKKDSRTWLITVNPDNSFDAVGHDIVKAATGKQAGNAAQSIYSLNVGSKGSRTEVEFEDKTYLVDEKSAIMISNFKAKKSDKGTAGKTTFSLKKISDQ
jgi:hypothetical protein